MIACNHAPTVHAFMHTQLGLHWSADFRGVIYAPDEYRDVMMQPEQVAIAIGYNAFIGRTCCMHTIIQRPDLLTRKILREAFEYPFLVAGCEAVLGLVDSTNAAALKFDRKLGFQEIARVPNGATEGDLVVLRMLRADCRWLSKPH